MAEAKQSFQLALAVTRAGNVFTTHTPVAAGFDRFAPELMRVHFEHYVQSGLGISLQELLALGRQNPNDPSEPFSMAYLALRGSGAVNGVSRLHGQVSRRIFQVLFSRWPEVEVPIQHVTNGVHVPTWDSAQADALWTEACGKQRWRGDLANVQQDVRNVSDTDFWRMRSLARSSLVEYIRQRLSRQLAGQGASADEITQAAHIFDPEILTIGFGRRFASYKRPNLLLHDPDRLLRILTGADRPVQLILAGKAHPQDTAGQDLVQQWISWIHHTPARSRAVFLSDYDMHLTQHMVQGVDLWLNTPRRPWEACGTSGMKVLVNGGLNLSELDGWWAEAYSPDVGWALGDGQEHGDDAAWDAGEARQLYDLLEYEVVPEFYERDAAGVPVAWIRRMRESMARLTPEFSANRCVREYTERFYLPSAIDYSARSADQARTGQGVIAWSDHLSKCWSQLRFSALAVNTEGGRHNFQVQVHFGNLDENAVRVELYAEPAEGGASIHTQMAKGPQPFGSDTGATYVASVSADRPASHFTPRVIPYCPGTKVPLEANQILWYR